MPIIASKYEFEKKSKIGLKEVVDLQGCPLQPSYTLKGCAQIKDAQIKRAEIKFLWAKVAINQEKNAQIRL